MAKKSKTSMNPEELKKEERKITANEFTKVKDVKNNLLYTKDGFIVGYLRLMMINIELLSNNELRSMTNTLSANFKPEKQKFSYLIIPRTADMDDYLSSLVELYEQEVTSYVKKKLLNIMITQASKKIMNGSNFEHQVYIRVWEKYNANSYGVENKIFERLNDFQNRYLRINNESKILDDKEILKLCNLFGNGNQALFETYDDMNYTPIPMIKGGM